MDGNFSPQVKEIISYSREEALRLGNDFIGTEHLLLGLIRDGENTAIKVLKQLNVDLYELRKEVELAVRDKQEKYCQHQQPAAHQAGRKSDSCNGTRSKIA
jgi:ATPases with chaperone activity, ATP-binding subunit